jgi:hydrogenase maturation protease
MPMEVSTGVRPRVRVLGLGNQILADDAFGILAAREVERRMGDRIEVMVSSEAGFNLIDCLVGASRLVIVDTIQTGAAPPGTIHVFEEEDFRAAPGGSPHCAGICEVLAVARKLGLAAPARVTIAAVEAADCSTVGGAMHPDVLGAIPSVADWILRQCDT